MNTKPQDMFESGAQSVIKAIAPKDQQQLWMDHYRANRNAWNVGVGALGGATVAALANGAANAFGRDDRGNGGGSSWGWLAPMALGAAGMWAWNKWGGKLTNYLDTRTKQAQQRAKNDQVWLDRYSRFTNWTQGKGWNTDEEYKKSDQYDQDYEDEVKNNPELRKLRQRQERESASYRQPQVVPPPRQQAVVNPYNSDKITRVSTRDRLKQTQRDYGMQHLPVPGIKRS